MKYENRVMLPPNFDVVEAFQNNVETVQFWDELNQYMFTVYLRYFPQPLRKYKGKMIKRKHDLVVVGVAEVGLWQILYYDTSKSTTWPDRAIFNDQYSHNTSDKYSYYPVIFEMQEKHIQEFQK